MKVYELIFESEHKGVFRVSLVKDPAIEATLIKFSSDKEENLHFFNEEKRIIYSVAMRPNKLIYRKNISNIPGVIEPANVFYTAETIESLQQNYFRQKGNSSTNINHNAEGVFGVFPFESWIVKDTESDKSKSLGLETINGDWVMGYKIDNEAIWEDCKAGKLDGLSIEAHLGFKENSINFNNEKQMTKAEKLFKMMTDFFAADSKELAPGVFGESTAVGSVVNDKDGNPVKSAEFEVDGKKFKTDENGLIIEPEKAPDGKTVEELTAENAALMAEIESLKGEKSTAEADKVKSETDLVKMTTEKTEKETLLATMKAEKETAEATITKMKAELVEALKIKDDPRFKFEAEKPYEQMSNKEKMKYNRENKR